MFKKYFIILISLLIFLSIFSNIINFYIQNTKESHSPNSSNINSHNWHFPTGENFFWPTPGYNNITSYFGKRKSPTTGKMSNHSGIDIGASEGSYIYSIQSGIVTFVGFNGANGYSIHVENSDFIFMYAHVSPNFMVSKNTYINIGEIIATVGPKYVQNSPNNPYKDKTGKSTNGSTTGPHLHLTIKKDGIAVNPLDFL